MRREEVAVGGYFPKKEETKKKKYNCSALQDKANLCRKNKRE